MDNNNHVELVRPEHITSLATSGYLLAPEVNVWTATKQDRATSEEITISKKASIESGKFTQRLLANNPLHKKVLNYRQTIYNWAERKFLPWSKEWYCHSALLPEALDEWNTVHLPTFNKLADEFVDHYPTIVSDMAFTQGDLFNRNNYPSQDWVRGRLNAHLYVTNVPLDDPRVQVSHDLADDLYKHYQRQAERNAEHRERMVRSVFNKQVEQLITVMESISHCCDAETSVDDNGNVKVRRRKLYDNTIQRALELSELYQQFNATQNPDLNRVCVSLKKTLSNVSVDALRESDHARAAVKSEVDDLLSNDLMKKFRL